jgi:hypothetical protein
MIELSLHELESTLALFGGNRTKAAKALSMSRQKFTYQLKTLKSYKGEKINPPKIIQAAGQDILVIADTQITPNSPVHHLESLAIYIWKHKPDIIVHIGDHWDFESLSTYASPKEAEGKRLYADLQAGFDAFEIIMDYTEYMNLEYETDYNPQKHFLMGNHENRLKRFISQHPVLEGCFDLNKFVLDQGWEVHEMNVPLWINDICFVHYLENPMSGKPVGGAMEGKLSKFPHSFVHGHQQQHQYARRQNLLGRPHFGICAGAFYPQDEDYRGANNTEIRGFNHLRAFTNRFGYLDYDAEFVSLERLLEKY